MSHKLPPGHGWAYLGVLLGLAASVAGNVANTVLTVSDVDLRLRIPFAVAWPVFVYIGIEVLTRVEWMRNWRHWIARLMLMGPMTLVAAFMSYLHLHHLMILSGEPGLAQAVGPIAIDGTLFGCTVALLVTRHVARVSTSQDGERKSLAERVAAARQTITDVASAAAGKAEEPTPTPAITPEPVADEVETELQEILKAEVETIKPVSPPTPRTYTPRGQWDIAKAVALIADADQSDASIAELVGVGVKTIQRARRAYILLRANPTNSVPPEWKVPAAVVDVIRREVRR
jgi:hypothetical protein